jgi:hypothetical protein
MEIRGLLPTFPQDVNKSEQMGGFKAIIEISLFGSELDRIYGTLYQVKYEIYIYIYIYIVCVKRLGTVKGMLGISGSFSVHYLLGCK